MSWDGLKALVRRLVHLELTVLLVVVGAFTAGTVVLLALDPEGFRDGLEAYAFREFPVPEGVDTAELISAVTPYANSLELVERDGRRVLVADQILDAEALNSTAMKRTSQGGPPEFKLGTRVFRWAFDQFSENKRLVFPLLVQIGLLCWFGWRNGRPFRSGMQRRGSPWILGIAAAIVAIVLTEPIEWAMEAIGYAVVEQEVIVEAFRSPGWLLMALFAVIGAPIAEELFFRGWALPALREVAPTWVAVLLSASLFAAIHFHPPAVPIYLLYGVILAWVYLRSGSLIAPILGHALINAFGVALLLWF